MDIGGGACSGCVGLTFDDGPSPTTAQLLRVLVENDLRATMFNIGGNAVARPDLVRAQLDAGMWLGNHTYTHPYLTELDHQQACDELANTQRALTDIVGERVALFRPPYGATNERVRATATALDLLEVLWTVDSRDWDGASADEIVAAAESLESGDIMLMHDFPAATIEAVPRIAQVLRAKGLRVGSISYTREPVTMPGAGTTYHATAVEP